MFTVGIFADTRNWVKCLLFVLVSVFMVCMAAVLVYIAAVMLGVDVLSMERWWLEISQFVQSVTIFLLSAWVYALLVSRSPISFLSAGRSAGTRQYLAAVVAVLSVQPLINLLSYYNSLIPLPPGWEEWIMAMEEEAVSLMNLFMEGSGVADFAVTLLLMAVVPAITEEFFFRGALLSLCRNVFKNTHLAVWVGAAIFSFIHFQFTGFLPRMFLGAIFGYMVVWSGSVWLPVVAHFVNNALAVAAYKMLGAEAANADLQDLVSTGGYYATLVCFTLVFVVCLWQLRRRS